MNEPTRTRWGEAFDLAAAVVVLLLAFLLTAGQLVDLVLR